MNKLKDARLKTEHTSNAVENNKEKFDSYMYNEKGVLVIKFEDLESKYNIFENFELDNALIKEEEKKLYKRVHKTLSIAYHDLKDDDKSLIKIYFKVSLSKVRNLKDIRFAFNNAILASSNPDYNKLNDYQDKIVSNLDDIEKFLLKKSKLLSERDDAKDAYKKSYDDWSNHYNNKLKNYYKGYFSDKEDEDYREYFLDLLKPKSRNKKDDKVEDTLKDEVKPILKEESEDISEKSSEDLPESE